MKSIFSALLSFAICSTAMAALTGAHQAHTVDTCADSSIATLFVELFSPTRTAHVVRTKMDVLAAYDSAVGTRDNFQYQGPSFRAWRTPQNFTVPFYQLSNQALGGGDFVFLPANPVNGSPPTPPAGFVNNGVAGYAYSTQVCGSVPLYSAANAAQSDHYWTIDLNDHNALIAMSGWVDDGIPFYVLPLESCSCSVPGGVVL